MPKDDLDVQRIPKLLQELKKLQAAQRVDDRKWQMKIDLIEMEIERIRRAN